MPSDSEFFTIPPLSYFSPARSGELADRAAPATDTQAESETVDAKLEKLVAARTLELRQMIASLEADREEEKRGLARQLHDDLGSALTALSMHIAILFRKLPDDPALVERSVQINALLGSIAEAVRRIQNNVRPEKLDVFGIKAAVAEHAHEFERRSGIVCRVDLPDEELSYSPQVEITLFRAMQEILSGIAADGTATHVEVVLDDTDDGIVFSIRDNGTAAFGQRSVGSPTQELANIRERVVLLGGDMRIVNSAGKFTRIVVTLPGPRNRVAEK